MARGEALDILSPRVEIRRERRRLLQSRWTGPRFRDRAAPVAADQPDRPLQMGPQFLAKEIRHRGEITRIVRIAYHPFSRLIAVGFMIRRLAPPLEWRGNIAHRLDRSRAGDAKQTQLRILCFRGFVLAIVVVGQRGLHVRLPGSQPHVADQDVLEGQRILSLNCHRRGRGAIGKRRKIDPPGSIRTGRRGSLMVSNGDGYLLSWFGRAPHGDLAFLLEYHVIAEDGGDMNIASGDRRMEGNRDQKRKGGTENRAKHGWEDFGITKNRTRRRLVPAHSHLHTPSGPLSSACQPSRSSHLA